MSPIMGIGLSGLAAAERRLEVSASNVANARSVGFRVDENGVPNDGYQPRQVQQTSLQGGGVRTQEVSVSPASILSYQPGNPDADKEGLVPAPNVNLAEEFVNQILAQRAYEASAQIIRTEGNRLKTLLDVMS